MILTFGIINVSRLVASLSPSRIADRVAARADVLPPPLGRLVDEGPAAYSRLSYKSSSLIIQTASTDPQHYLLCDSSACCGGLAAHWASS
jgi:hypothetical protein